MNTAKINVSRIDKTALFEGKNGKYLDIVLFENRDGTDQYGNDGFVVQDIPRERRDAGEKGPIIGNWRRVEKRGQAAPASSPAGNADMAGDDIPFSPFCKQSKLPL
jgi:hypothetical protein